MAKTDRNIARQQRKAEDVELIVQVLLRRWERDGRRCTMEQAINAVAAKRAEQKSTTIKASREYVRHKLRTIDLLEAVLPAAIARATGENILLPRRLPVGDASLHSQAHYRLALEWAERIRAGQLPQDALPPELVYVVEQTDPRWNRLGWFMQAFSDDIPEGTRTKLVGGLYDACRALIRDRISPSKPPSDKSQH